MRAFALFVVLGSVLGAFVGAASVDGGVVAWTRVGDAVLLSVSSSPPNVFVWTDWVVDTFEAARGRPEGPHPHADPPVILSRERSEALWVTTIVYETGRTQFVGDLVVEVPEIGVVRRIEIDLRTEPGWTVLWGVGLSLGVVPDGAPAVGTLRSWFEDGDGVRVGTSYERTLSLDAFPCGRPGPPAWLDGGASQLVEAAAEPVRAGYALCNPSPEEVSVSLSYFDARSGRPVGAEGAAAWRDVFERRLAPGSAALAFFTLEAAPPPVDYEPVARHVWSDGTSGEARVEGPVRFAGPATPTAPRGPPVG